MHTQIVLNITYCTLYNSLNITDGLLLVAAFTDDVNRTLAAVDPVYISRVGGEGGGNILPVRRAQLVL